MHSERACIHHGAGTEEAHLSCVSLVPIFNHLEQKEMDEIAGMARPVSLKKGELLYNAGDSSDALYIVHKGKMRICRLAENGKEQLIRILKPGDFTGELALFKETVHDAYAEAMEKTEICSVRREKLRELLLRYPQISLKILTELSSRLEEAEHQVTSFATEGAETRIALYIARQAEEQNTSAIQLPMTRKDLASYLGTTPETISRKLTKFEEEGWIQQESQRKIRILDLEALLLD